MALEILRSALLLNIAAWVAWLFTIHGPGDPPPHLLTRTPNANIDFESMAVTVGERNSNRLSGVKDSIGRTVWVAFVSHV